MNLPQPEVYLASPWIPAEWVRAHGLTPRGWFARSDPGRPALAAGVCPFAGRAAHFVESLDALADARCGAEPELAVRSTGFSRCGGSANSGRATGGLEPGLQTEIRFMGRHPQIAFVFATVCDQLRRAGDSVVRCTTVPTFLFNVPAAWQSPASHRLFRAELERFGRFLIGLEGCSPTASALESVLRSYDAARRWLRAAAPVTPACVHAEAIARFHWTGEAEAGTAGKPGSEGGVPLALLGGPCTDGALARIERAGGRVVLDGSEAGERSLFPELPAGDWVGDPVAALAAAYLDHGVDAFLRPNTGLYAWLGGRLADRGARGIVLRAQVGCDLWRAEAQSLREAFDLPVLTIEPDENPDCAARELTRLTAFVEMLR